MYPCSLAVRHIENISPALVRFLSNRPADSSCLRVISLAIAINASIALAGGLDEPFLNVLTDDSDIVIDLLSSSCCSSLAV